MTLGVAPGETQQFLAIPPAGVSAVWGFKLGTGGHTPKAYEIQINYASAPTGVATVEGTDGDKVTGVWRVLDTFTTTGDIRRVVRTTKYMRINNGSNVAVDAFVTAD